MVTGSGGSWWWLIVVTGEDINREVEGEWLYIVVSGEKEGGGASDEDGFVR